MDKIRGMEKPSHQKMKQNLMKNKISKQSTKNSNLLKMGGPGKGILKRPGLQNSSRSCDHQSSHKGHTYFPLQDNEDIRDEEHETMESFSPHVGRVGRVVDSSVKRGKQYEEEEVLQEHVYEDDSQQSADNIDVQRDENMGSTSNGRTVTRKETRALTETRRRSNKDKLVFKVDECAGRIVGEDSQLFITKGGCVMRQFAIFDGTSWRKQSPTLKTDIITKCTENSNYDPNCRVMTHAMDTQLASQHRNKQYRLHKYYKSFSTKEEALTHPPNGIKVPQWVNLCERFASENFQKISTQNTKNKSFNEVPPAVGTVSIARVVDMKRRMGEEVSAIDNYKIGHFSKRKNKMVNEKADEIWNELLAEGATSSCTPAEICLKRLHRIPGYIKGRSVSTKQSLETENLRMELELEKKKSRDLEAKVEVITEEQVQLQGKHNELKEKVDFMMEHFSHLSRLPSQKTGPGHSGMRNSKISAINMR